MTDDEKANDVGLSQMANGGPMKLFSDLTDDEIGHLTDEQVSRFIDIECAEHGIPLLPNQRPQVPVLPEGADLAVYTIAGLHFLNPADAKAVEDVLAHRPRITTDYFDGEYSKRRAKPVVDRDLVSTEYVFTDDYAERQKEAIALRADARKAQGEYEDIRMRRDEVSRKIMEVVAKERAITVRRWHLRSEFERYVVMAEGDPGIAARFLAKAHPDAKQLLPDLFSQAAEDSRKLATAQYQASVLEESLV